MPARTYISVDIPGPPVLPVNEVWMLLINFLRAGESAASITNSALAAGMCYVDRLTISSYNPRALGS